MAKDLVSIKAEKNLSEDKRTYHLSTEVSSSHHECFYRPIRESSGEALARVGTLGTQLVRELLALDGVVLVEITPYSVCLEKGRVFKWWDLGVRVLEVIVRALTQHGCGRPYIQSDDHRESRWGNSDQRLSFIESVEASLKTST